MNDYRLSSFELDLIYKYFQDLSIIPSTLSIEEWDKLPTREIPEGYRCFEDLFWTY